jgi:hypothetical protein
MGAESPPVGTNESLLERKRYPFERNRTLLALDSRVLQSDSRLL